MLSLELTELAKKDLKEIAKYTTQEWGKEQAKIYRALLNKQIKNIQANPKIGHQKHDLEEGILCLKANRHLIFYEITDETVYVLRILHDSMDYTQRLQ